MRKILARDDMHRTIADLVQNFHKDVVEEVTLAVE